MWYNFDLLKKQHSFIHHAKECHVSYVQIEHASGDVVIYFNGNKSGTKYETSGFSFGRSSTEVQQASYLTMRITMKNIQNALPNIKCCRESYAIHGTMFVIHDKRYANEVLTHLFGEYEAPIEMKKYLLTMFDDWGNLASSKPIVSAAYAIPENVIVGNIVTKKTTEKSKKNQTFLAFFRRLFSCGSNWENLEKTTAMEEID